jgi:hypothetical protein
MRAIGLGFFSLFLSFSLTAQAAPGTSVSTTTTTKSKAALKRPTFGAWSVQESWSLSAVHAEEKDLLSESTRADVAGSIELKKVFDDQLIILARPAFRFVTGRDQDVFSDRLPKDKIYADEAKVGWMPSEGSILEAGALNQSHLENGLLVDERPFPAARLQTGFTAGKKTLIELAAQIAIPSSYTLEAQATDNEPLPKLQTYSAILDQLVSEDVSVRAGATYFTFQDLPQIVAVDSKRLGNTVDVFSSSTGRFLYNYQGVALQAQAGVKLGAWDLAWKGEGIRNTSAPSKLGTGYISTLQIQRPLSVTHDGGLSASYYRVQPDTAPAMYTDAIYSNNRIGAGLNAYVNHNRWGLQFKASYFQDTPYYANDLMGDRNLFLLSVGNLIDDQTSKR